MNLAGQEHDFERVLQHEEQQYDCNDSSEDSQWYLQFEQVFRLVLPAAQASVWVNAYGAQRIVAIWVGTTLMVVGVSSAMASVCM